MLPSLFFFHFFIILLSSFVYGLRPLILKLVLIPIEIEIVYEVVHFRAFEQFASIVHRSRQIEIILFSAISVV